MTTTIAGMNSVNNGLDLKIKLQTTTKLFSSDPVAGHILLVIDRATTVKWVLLMHCRHKKLLQDEMTFICKLSSVLTNSWPTFHFQIPLH